MCGVLWDQISPEKLEEIPILQMLQSPKSCQPVIWDSQSTWAKKTLI